MNIYKAKFGECSSGEECSIILAESEKEAMQMIEKDNGNPLYPFFVRVKREPKSWDIGDKTTEYFLTKVPMEKGIIYTGHYCC